MKRKQKKHYCQISSMFSVIEGTPNTSVKQKFFGLVREFTTISEQYPLGKTYFRSKKLFLDEKRRHVTGKDWFSIHPFSIFEYYRHYVMLAVYLLAIIYDQIDIAYIYKYQKFILYTEECFFVINILCFLDMIICLFTGYLDQTIKWNESMAIHSGFYRTKETDIELDKKKIAKKYLKTFFLPDLFSFTNILHCTSNIFEKKSVYYCYASIRHLRLFRLITVGKYADIISYYKQMGRDTLLILGCCFLFTFLSVFLGALMCYIPDITSYVYNEDRHIYLKSLQGYYMVHPTEEFSEFKLFLHSTLDSFSLLFLFRMHKLECNMEINAISTLTLIVGNALKVFLFFTIFSILNRRYNSRVKFMTFINEVKNYVRREGLGQTFCDEIIRYCNNKMKEEYFNQSEILSTLQKNMQFEIFSQSSLGFLRTCQLFRKLPNDFIIQLSLKLKRETYVPGVTVIAAGEIATCMYFIATGTVAIYSGDGTEICHLSDGEYVGEIGILQSTARLADVVTIEHCELYRLDIRDFQEVIKPNSKFYKRIYKIAMKRMNVHVRMESDH